MVKNGQNAAFLTAVHTPRGKNQIHYANKDDWTIVQNRPDLILVSFHLLFMKQEVTEKGTHRFFSPLNSVIE